jgi:hypothetical protein
MLSSSLQLPKDDRRTGLPPPAYVGSHAQRSARACAPSTDVRCAFSDPTFSENEANCRVGGRYGNAGTGTEGRKLSGTRRCRMSLRSQRARLARRKRCFCSVLCRASSPVRVRRPSALLLEFAEDVAWETAVWTRRFIVYALDHSCVFCVPSAFKMRAAELVDDVICVLTVSILI